MLTGHLDDFTLPDIFRLMSSSKRTGKVDVVRSAGEGKVFFREGEVYYAESTVSREPLGQKLIRWGVLTEGALMKALDESATSGARVGEILVRNGNVSSEQLERAVQQQIEDAVFDLLHWTAGEFSWDPGVVADVEVPISVSVENLIIEASRRMDELEVIARVIPSEKTILRMAPVPPEGALEINITPDEWRMLVLVNGTRTIHEIAATTGTDHLTAMRSLYGLVSANLLQVVERATEATGSPAGGSEFVDLDDAVVEAEEEGTSFGRFDPLPPTEASDFGFADLLEQPLPVSEVPAEPASEPLVEEIEPDEFLPLPVQETDLDEVQILAVEEPASEDEIFFSSLEDVPEPSAIESFDRPLPEELSISTPVDDDFLSDLLGEVPSTSTASSSGPRTTVPPLSPPPTPEAPLAPAPAAAPPDAPGAPPETPGVPAPSPLGSPPRAIPNPANVDRASMARELAGLFDDVPPRTRSGQPGRARAATPGSEPDGRKRVEDDDQVNKGLISRLIDGVKGL